MTAKMAFHPRAAYALLFSAGLHLAAGGLVALGTHGIAATASVPVDTPHLDARIERGGVTLPAASRAAASEGAFESPPGVALRAERRASAPATAGSGADRIAIAVPAPYYYPASELDLRPRPLTPVELEEPGRDAGEGYLILKLLIDETGTVDDVVMVVNDGPEAFARGARAAFGRARYAPGVKRGQPVKSQMLIEVKLGAAAG